MQISAAMRSAAFGDLARGRAPCVEQRARRGQRVGPARADRGRRRSSGSITSPLPEITRRSRRVGDDQHRFEPAQRRGRCASPWRARPRRGAGSRRAPRAWPRSARASANASAVDAGEARQHLAVAQPPHLAARCASSTVWPERDLAVAGDDDALAAPHREDGRAVKLCAHAARPLPAPADARCGTRARAARPRLRYSFWVVESRSWPSSSWIARRSTSASSRCVA